MHLRNAVLVSILALGPARSGAEAAQDAGEAIIEVRLPSLATLTIDTYPTRQGGSVRMFMTPPLASGKTFAYELVATWNENGKTRTLTRQALVKAGGRTLVDFGAPAVAAKADPKTTREKVKSRTFLFTYEATVKDLAPGKEAHIWLPYPSSSPEQTVQLVSKDVPAPEKIGKEKQYGSQIFYVKAKADANGKIPVRLTFKVTRKEVLTQGDPRAFLKPSAKEQVTRFLQPDKLVPIGGKGLMLIEGKKLPQDQFASAKMLYELVNDHMKYNKEGTGWGRGDSDWACDSKFGNCTDFHSLFISLARAQKIPAKFEMGFSIPLEYGKGKIGGYHCWAWFLPNDKGWVPVDISEANRHPKMRDYYFGNLTEDRVTFSTGRDITLTPPQKGPALNYFIYPYVEVDGQPLAAEKVTRAFSYEDVK